MRRERLIAALQPDLRHALGERIHLFTSLGSTNDFLSTATHPALCITRLQTNARGRNGKPWLSTRHCLALSLAWVFDSFDQLGGLSLAAGVAAATWLDELGVACKLKWPNDLLVDERKLGGLLVELYQHGGQPVAVIGIGINILEAPQGATWLHRYLPGVPPNEQLAAGLVNHVYGQIVRLCTHGFGAIRQDWQKLDVWQGRMVVVRTSSGRIDGVHQGIDESGRLLLATHSGIRSFSSGEVRMRLE